MEEEPTSARKFSERPEYQWFMLVLGWILVAATPIVGLFPGPGGVVVFAVGLAVILKHSRWAKRRYARLTRAYPEYGDWINWAIGRGKGKGTPDFPPIKRDIIHMFRRDDIDQEMP